MSDNAFSDEVSEEYRRHEELDFLDRCAIAAMTARHSAERTIHRVDLARMAYEIAEAMLAERTNRRANRGT